MAKRMAGLPHWRLSELALATALLAFDLIETVLNVMRGSFLP
jgi:hypothetical protein